MKSKNERARIERLRQREVDEARLDQKFEFPALTRADIAQALEDAGKSKRTARRTALRMDDCVMRRLANRIIEATCNSGDYWQLCEEAAEGV